MNRQNREGLTSNGIYFWHDYPIEQSGAVNRDWVSHIDKINEKYAYTWDRFVKRLARPGQKRFIISNTQFNLNQFSCSLEDYRDKFSFDEKFCSKLHTELESIVEDSYDVVLITNCLNEAITLRAKSVGSSTVVRYGALQLLPCNKYIAHASIFNQISSEADYRMIAGSYMNGCVIEYLGGGVAIIFRNLPDNSRIAWAEVSALSDGFLCVFHGKRQNVHKAYFDSNKLHFSNRTQWTKSC